MIEMSRVRPDAESAGLELRLRVSDPESVAALGRLAPGAEREAVALRALRIGLLALRQAAGAIDADAVRREGEQILNRLQVQLNGQQSFIQERLEGVLQQYFDPRSGRFAERVERLVRKDGELERVLREQVGAEDSTLRRTLAESFGPQSALMKVLSPTESEGLLLSLQGVVQESLREQRERLLAQFSLDTEDSALSRLVRELGQSHRDLTGELKTSIGDVVGEFSLDKEDSALSKLVKQVNDAQQRISAEFSLNDDGSALARMRREMLGVLTSHAEADAAFREAVMKELAGLQARRAEADRSTRHGLEFEDELVQQLLVRAQACGDLAAPTGTHVGLIPNSKVGDAVWELGPDHAAAGARIVVEAKEKKGVGLADARAEIEVARKNRGADVGLFVFSAKTAPEGQAPFQRLGADVYVVWDATDPGSDVWLDAGIEVARALSTRQGGERAARAADYEAIDKAVLAIEKQAGLLAEVETSANTIRSASEKILRRVQVSRASIARNVDRLQEALSDLKGTP